MKKIRAAAYIAIVFAVAWCGNYIIQRCMYPLKYYDLVSKTAAAYDMDPLLLMAIIKAESGFNEKAISLKGAKGLMQLQDETAVWCAQKMGLTEFEPEQVCDPEVNIKIGTWYFCEFLLPHFDYNQRVALAAYNAGQGNVTKWLANNEYSKDNKTLDVIPYQETDDYVNRIEKYYEKYKKIYR